MSLLRKQLKVIDCTLRDGGYQNNWQFSNDFISDYLRVMDRVNVSGVEVGLRSKINQGKTGPLGVSDPNFLAKLNFGNLKNLFLMTNFSELENLSPDEVTDFLPSDLAHMGIQSIRIACSPKQISKAGKTIDILKNQGFRVCLNIMRVSTLSTKELLNILKNVDAFSHDILYLADSFGALTPKSVEVLMTEMRNKIKHPIGIHAPQQPRSSGLKYTSSI